MGNKFKVRNCNPRDPRHTEAYERLREGAVLAHLLSHPYYQADKNLFFAEADGKIVGYINILPELGIRRVVLEYSVSPSCQPEAILPALMKPALKRATESGARVAHLSIPSGDTAAAEILSKLGFKPAHRFYEMRLKVADLAIEAVDTDWKYRYFKPGDERLLADIQDRCFSGTWGYNPNTVEHIAWQLKVRHNRPEDVVLAIDQAEVTGYCWTESECGLDPSTGDKKGRIYMLGVVSGYRNTGLGRKLLVAGIRHLKNQGRQIIDITVDAENIAAVTLYRSLRFKIYGETVWYEKFLD